MAQQIDPRQLALLTDWLGKIGLPGEIPMSVEGGVPGDVDLPRDPTPLDTNRLPEVNTRAMGQNPSGLMPNRNPPPLDANRLPETGRLAGQSSMGAAHPPLASGVDALDTFLGGASVRPSAGPLSADELGELGRDRTSLRDEYTRRIGNSIGGGDTREAARAGIFRNDLDQQIHNDPFTGDAAQAKAAADADNYHKVSQLIDPSTPEARGVAQRDAVALQKSLVEHPNPNVSPFGDATSPVPSVPGAVPAPGAGRMAGGGGTAPAPGGGPTPITGGDFESRFAQGTADLSPSAAANVRALLEYRANIPSGNVLSRPEWSTIVGRARAIDPTFDVTQFDARKKLRESFTSGEAGQRVRSLNALSGHVTDLDTQREALGNFNVGAVANPAINWIERQLLGNGKFAAFDTTNGLVNTEMGKFLGGANATNELRNSVGAGIDSNSSDDAIAQHIGSISNLSREQYNALLAQAQGVPYLQGLIEKQITPTTTKFLGRGQQGASAAAAPAGEQVIQTKSGRKAVMRNGVPVYID